MKRHVSLKWFLVGILRSYKTYEPQSNVSVEIINSIFAAILFSKANIIRQEMLIFNICLIIMVSKLFLKKTQSLDKNIKNA